MNKKKVILLILCSALAVILSYIQYSYFKELNKGEPMVNVLVAKEDIKAGEPVNEKLTLKAIPRSAVTNGMADKVGENLLYAKIDISAGSYITKNMISSFHMPVVIGDNRRVTISVDIVSSLAGKIRPGDVVDIGFIPSDQAEGEAEVIAVAVPILELLNDRAEPIFSRNSKQENQYDTGAKIPAVATLVVHNADQGVMIKEREARGRLFFLGY